MCIRDSLRPTSPRASQHRKDRSKYANLVEPARPEKRNLLARPSKLADHLGFFGGPPNGDRSVLPGEGVQGRGLSCHQEPLELQPLLARRPSRSSREEPLDGFPSRLGREGLRLFLRQPDL